MKNRLTYNVPGCGTLTANLFKYTCSLRDFLQFYEHIDRFRRINQLGKLSEVFQGVHHKRYDYVFLQLALISELCKNKKSDFGLSAEREFCGELSEMGKHPSMGELLQCLAILTNIGYLEGTFATARAWLTYLKNDKEKYNFFKSGLDPQDRPLLKSIVDNYDYYRFNTILGLFFLQRYKRKSNEHVEFASKLLRLYANHDRTDIKQAELFELYRTIRTISFITLDSFYAPVPFNLELSSILLGFETLYESLFVKNTTYRIALKNLERVLQDSVYLSSDSCLCTTRTSEHTLEELKTKSITSMMTLYYAVCPSCNKEDLNTTVKELDWEREKKLVLNFRYRISQTPNLPKALSDEVKWEKEQRDLIGKSSCRVSLLKNARNNEIKLVFGLISKHNESNIKAALKSISQSIKFSNNFGERVLFRRTRKNENEYIRFALKAMFGWDKRFILENKNKKHPAVFVSQGKVDLIEKIDQYLASATEFLGTDELFEVEKMKDLVTKVNYSGLTIAYVGETKLFESTKTNASAEFDGILLTPNYSNGEIFGYVMEAKNYNGGLTDAKKQLKDRVSKQLVKELKMKILKLNNRAAYSKIELK